MSERPPEPTGEPSDSWRQLAEDAVECIEYDGRDDEYRSVVELNEMAAERASLMVRRAALLAAEEHLPRFEVVESSYSMPHDEPIPHVSIHQRWHARIKSRNGEITWTTETLEHRQHAIDAAHLLADLIGAKVTQEDGSEV